MYKRLLKTGVVIAGVLFFIVALSVLKVFISNLGTEGGTNFNALSSNYLEEINSEDLLIEDESEYHTPVINDQVQGIVELEDNDNKIAFYQSVVNDFSIRYLDSLGFVFNTIEFSDEHKYILLRFDRIREVSYEDKKKAAILISDFVFGQFEDKTGFLTDYLKVHLKKPEGDSFALSREDFINWVKSGENKDFLFENIIGKVFTEDIIYFDQKALEMHLKDSMHDGNTYSVEGENRKNPGIYIFVNRRYEEFDKVELENITTNIVKEVFVNYHNITGQKVDAFKFIDTNDRVIIVIYREDLKTIWLEGTDDTQLRDFIKSELASFTQN